MIRPFVLTDLDRILEIEQQSFPKSPYPPSVFLHLYWLHPRTFSVYAGPHREKKENEIYGYLIFSENGHLISLAIHPHHRQRGIAKALLKRAIRTLPGRKIWAEVRQSNQGALAFYQKLGFQIVGTLYNYYGSEDALLIQWIPPYLQKTW